MIKSPVGKAVSSAVGFLKTIDSQKTRSFCGLEFEERKRGIDETLASGIAVCGPNFIDSLQMLVVLFVANYLKQVKKGLLPVLASMNVILRKVIWFLLRFY